MKYQAQIDEHTFEIEVLDTGNVLVNGEPLCYNVQRGTKPEHFSLILGGRSHQIWIENGEIRPGGGPPPLRVHLHGFDYDVRVDDERSLKLKEFAGAAGSSEDIGQVHAPMPGLVVKLLVEPGQAVKKGEGVIIVEAMKMENEIRSPIDGQVNEIRVKERQAVEKGEILAIVG